MISREKIHSKFVSKAPTFITDVRAKSFVPKEAHAYFLHTKNYPIARARADMSGNMSITMNVVGTAILSAIHMGFSEVYLMGLDHSLFANLTNNHCYDDFSGHDGTAKVQLGILPKVLPPCDRVSLPNHKDCAGKRG